jgi:hypothetical protein
MQALRIALMSLSYFCSKLETSKSFSSVIAPRCTAFDDWRFRERQDAHVAAAKKAGKVLEA